MTKSSKMQRTFALLLGMFIVIQASFTSAITVEAAQVSDTQAIQMVFDATYYANNNPDVVAAVGNSTKALLNHYKEHGIYEGRSASAEFNASAYRERYSDLNSTFGNNWYSYCRHYVTCGRAENRNASAGGPNYTGKPFNNAPSAKAVSTEGYDCIGSYSTRYKATQARATNIAIAAGHLNGTVVNPGGEFSYSTTILPRTPENGYVEAPVFINKEHAMGIGGGICQVSSTLYACMKTIGFPATERHPHSLPVDYVPEGWDATISGTTLDLKFINTYNKPLMITASADGGKLTVSLWLKK